MLDVRIYRDTFSMFGTEKVFENHGNKTINKHLLRSTFGVTALQSESVVHIALSPEDAVPINVKDAVPSDIILGDRDEKPEVV